VSYFLIIKSYLVHFSQRLNSIGLFFIMRDHFSNQLIFVYQGWENSVAWNYYKLGVLYPKEVTALIGYYAV